MFFIEVESQPLSGRDSFSIIVGGCGWIKLALTIDALSQGVLHHIYFPMIIDRLSQRVFHFFSLRFQYFTPFSTNMLLYLKRHSIYRYNIVSGNVCARSAGHCDLTHLLLKKRSSIGVIGCFLDDVLLPCDHGLDFDISLLCENSIYQSRCIIRHRAGMLCVFTNNRIC